MRGSYLKYEKYASCFKAKSQVELRYPINYKSQIISFFPSYDEAGGGGKLAFKQLPQCDLCIYDFPRIGIVGNAVIGDERQEDLFFRSAVIQEPLPEGGEFCINFFADGEGVAVEFDFAKIDGAVFPINEQVNLKTLCFGSGSLISGNKSIF